ncbi:MAG TPA: hypothetical protein VIM64_11515 [Puia sp.]
MQTVRYADIGFTADHVASLTEAEWLKEAKGEYFGHKSDKAETEDLKRVYKLCVKAVRGDAKEDEKK